MHAIKYQFSSYIYTHTYSQFYLCLEKSGCWNSNVDDSEFMTVRHFAATPGKTFVLFDVTSENRVHSPINCDRLLF